MQGPTRCFAMCSGSTYTMNCQQISKNLQGECLEIVITRKPLFVRNRKPPKAMDHGYVGASA